MRSCFLWMSKENYFLRQELLLVKMLWRLEMTKDLEWYLNLVDKARQGLRIHFNFEMVLLWVKCYQTVLHVTQKLFVKKRVNWYSKHYCCLFFKKLPQPPQTSTDTTLINQQLSKLRLNFMAAKDYNSLHILAIEYF